MSTNKGYEKYKKIDVSTASQNRLIIMLYDGAIKFLENACNAMDKKHGTEEAHNNIMKAQEIIYELLSSLNYDAKEIAERLASIYTYMNQRLTEANISKTKPPILEVIKYLQELKGAWESVEQKMSSSNNTISNTSKEENNQTTQNNSTSNNNKSYDKNFTKKDDKAVTSKLNITG
ncbi:flagellar export chaperone FliS [Brachyspira sp. SAP_772]|uniref:flagellar export chaperone FliS n=1 Tax=Brachyspira sp. SAP_772 TaxID=2608385 RepID=UPI0012F51C30|nr:flagellar export chaperone FliS [Brachyspira sp. SAP_772]